MSYRSRKNAIVYLFVSLIFVQIVSAQDVDWLKKMKEIQLLSDTYDKVVEILGTPVERGRGKDTSEYFDFKAGRMAVFFEPGNCGDGMQSGWKVPKWSVVKIAFFLDEWVDPQKLEIRDFNGFIAKPIHESREGIEYSNDELGVDYIVNQGKVQSVIFRPGKKYTDLRCK
jgi:hypothetical protein